MVQLWIWLHCLPQWLRQAWAVAVVIFWGYVCFAPTDSDSPPIINDKIAHLIGNFGITGSLFIAGFLQHYVVLGCAVGAYAVLIEGVQYALPDRHFSLWDMVANVAGIVCALATIAWLQSRRSR